MFNGNNNQINALGNLSALTPTGLNSSAYTNLLTGTSGLTGLNTNLLTGSSGLTGLTGLTTGSDQINIGSEASGILGTGTTGGTDSVTSFIMQMISKLTSNSNTLAQQLLSGSTTGTGTTGTTTTDTTGTTGTGSAATTGAGKLDTSGVETKIRKGNGTDHTAGEPILMSGTMKAGVDGKDGTAEVTNQYVRADGKPSASNDPKAYKAQTGPVFENYCPCCGKKGTLSYAIGKESPEGSFFCDQSKGGCDVDYSVLGGQEHVTSGNIRYLKKAGNVTATGASSSTTSGSTNATNAASASNAAGGDFMAPQLNLPGVTISRDDSYYSGSNNSSDSSG